MNYLTISKHVLSEAVPKPPVRETDEAGNWINKEQFEEDFDRYMEYLYSFDPYE